MLTSPISFVSTANSSIFTGGDVIFADIESDTGNISIDNINKILKKKKINSISPVHFGGLPCDMKSINKLKKNINLLFMRMQRILLELNMIKTRLGHVNILI